MSTLYCHFNFNYVRLSLDNKRLLTYLLTYNDGGTLQKCYRKLRDHWNACGPLLCLTVHCSTLLCK